GWASRRASLPRPPPGAPSRPRLVALRREELPLLPRDLRRERAVGTHHAPPRNVVELVERADHRPRPSGAAGSQRDFSVGQHAPARDASHDAPHGAGEGPERRSGRLAALLSDFASHRTGQNDYTI